MKGKGKKNFTCNSKVYKISLVYHTNQTKKTKRAKQKKNWWAIKSRNGLNWEDLRALTTARAREFWKVVAVVKLRVNDRGSNGAGCSEIKIWTDASNLRNMW